MSIEKEELFIEVLKRMHASRFPGGSRSMDNSLALSGLYSDRSHAGIGQAENDRYEMLSWLKENGIYQKDSPNQFQGEDKKRMDRIAKGMIDLWESFKLNKVVNKDIAWIHPYGIHKALANDLATNMEDDTLKNVFCDSASPVYCIKEATKARDSGVGIHQAYGSWEKMVRAHFEHCKKYNLQARSYFFIDAKRLIQQYETSVNPSKDGWKKIAQRHLTNTYSPDAVNNLYRKIREEFIASKKENRKADQEKLDRLHNDIKKSGLGIDSNGKVLDRLEIGFKVGDAVYDFESKEAGIVTAIDGDTIEVNTPNGLKTWDKIDVTRDVMQTPAPEKSLEMQF